jgi:hypothetical protein
MRVSSGTRSPSLAPQETSGGPRAQAPAVGAPLPRVRVPRMGRPPGRGYPARRMDRMASTYPVTATANTAMPPMPMAETAATKSSS